MATKKNQETKKSRRKKRTPKRITESYLHNAGLYYLQRYSASAAHFRRIMMRKVDRSCYHHKDQDRDQCEKMVDALVEKFKRVDLLNDDVYARGKVLSLRRKGYGRRAIKSRLRAKGLNPECIAAALDKIDENYGHDDKSAAIRYMKRRRLGPFRSDKKAPETPEEEQKLKRRELGSLARAGFSYKTAKTVLAMSKKDTEEFL